MDEPFTVEVPVADVFGRVRIGRAIMQLGQTRGMPVQSTYQLMLIQSGEAFIAVGRRPVESVPAGTGILIRPEYRGHRRTVGAERSHQTWLAALPEVLTPAQIEALDAAPLTLPVSGEMDRLQAAILDVYHRHPAAEETLTPLVVGALLLYVAEARAQGLLREPVRHHPAVAMAREMVRRRLDERLSLADLAAAGHVTPEHLVRLFRRELGTTPARYLWAERVRTGVHLLEHTDLPVAEIAERAGFQTAGHFIRHVRAAAGLRPLEFRRRSRQVGEEVDAPPAVEGVTS